MSNIQKTIEEIGEEKWIDLLWRAFAIILTRKHVSYIRFDALGFDMEFCKAIENMLELVEGGGTKAISGWLKLE